MRLVHFRWRSAQSAKAAVGNVHRKAIVAIDAMSRARGGFGGWGSLGYLPGEPLSRDVFAFQHLLRPFPHVYMEQQYLILLSETAK